MTVTIQKICRQRKMRAAAGWPPGVLDMIEPFVQPG